MAFESIAGEADFAEAWDILAESVGDRTPAGRQQLCTLYLTSPDMALYCWRMGGSVAGVIGARVAGRNPAEGEIRHIAVSRALRHQGIGRALIAALSALYPGVRNWSAETDDDSVGFYRRLGCEVRSLGELYPGVVRYRCTLRN